MKIIVDGQQMTSYNGNTVLYDRSSNFLTLEFEFRNGWGGLVKTVQFIKGNTVYNKLMEENDTVVVPSEVTEGDWTLGVFGVNAENAVLATSSGLLLRVKLSAYKDNGSDPVEPTPTLFAQLIERIEECEDVANSVRQDADNGVFDGFSPEAFVTKVGKIVRITITDKEGTTSEEVTDGEGVAEGGSTGQILKKKSNTDYDTEWSQLDKSDVGLNNVENERQYSDNNPPPYPVTSVNGQTGDVTIFVPVKLSDLSNDTGFITNLVDNLANYYLKSEIYTKQEVTALINAIQKVTITIVEELPATGDSNVIYFVPKTGSGNDTYNEYIYINNTWEKIGDTDVDLSNYYTKSQTDTLLNNKANVSDIPTKTSDLTNDSGYITRNDFGSTTQAGTIKANGVYWTQISSVTGTLYGNAKTYNEYLMGDTNAFIAKGTLENVLTERIGTIETALTTLDVGGGVQ